MRCSWAKENEPLYIQYHDEEWGRPQRDSRKLFELLCLEGAQAGLSWITILKKREAYRQLFDQFDPIKIAAYDDDKVAQLLENPSIIRNSLKIKAFIKNAKAYINVEQTKQSFSDYIWSFVGDEVIQNAWASVDEIPAKTLISEQMSKQLKKDGFSFVGPTICYAFMQAAGLVNDHVTTCYCYTQLKENE